MKISLLASLALAAPHLVAGRYVMYADMYHLDFPNKTYTAGIDTVIMAFANSSYFVTPDEGAAITPPGKYKPFKNVTDMKPLFDEGTKFVIAIGGWGDDYGFPIAATNESTRELFATNVVAMMIREGFDGIDMDIEYPGGNGANYRDVPNSAKVGEITAFPLLLAAIKSKLPAGKTLSIAVPGLERDMIAYTPEQAPNIWPSVDYVNVMTYDLMNRRDNITKHHTDVKGSLATVDKYISLGLCADKINLGFAFYAKWFLTDDPACAQNPLGCKTALLETTDGKDTGNSSALTFETANYAVAPTNLTVSPDSSCGAAVGFTCNTTIGSLGPCCSSSSYCGNTAAHCGLACQPGYGKCNGATALSSFAVATKSLIVDNSTGGAYYYDEPAKLFWTMETKELIAQKFEKIVKGRGLGGVMAWSLGEDSNDKQLLVALQKGTSELGL